MFFFVSGLFGGLNEKAANPGGFEAFSLGHWIISNDS